MVARSGSLIRSIPIPNRNIPTMGLSYDCGTKVPVFYNTFTFRPLYFLIIRGIIFRAKLRVAFFFTPSDKKKTRK